MQNSFQKYGKWGWNLQNIGTRSLAVWENWKDWRLVTAALCSTSILTCNSLLLHWLLAPSLQDYQQWPIPQQFCRIAWMIRPNIFICDPSLNWSSSPWRWRACLLTHNTACYCLCQQAALRTAAVVQKAKGKRLSFALVLSHLQVTGTYPSAW